MFERPLPPFELLFYAFGNASLVIPARSAEGKARPYCRDGIALVPHVPSACLPDPMVLLPKNLATKQTETGPRGKMIGGTP